MIQHTCIYYRIISASSFPKEYIIPKAFGRFRENFTLLSVCQNCNHFFSRELELFLGRDSGEALLRLRYGLKAVTEAGDVRGSRIAMTVNVPGPWLGARVLLRPDDSGTKPVIEQLPQVAFLRPGEDWRWFSEEDLDEPRNVESYRQ